MQFPIESNQLASIRANRRSMETLTAIFAFICVTMFLPLSASALQGGKVPSVKDALGLEPLQKGSIDYDVPDAAAITKCKVQKAQTIGQSGWILLDPNGRLLRRFVDTNNDSEIDQWCYYKDGIEVYRDIDADGDSNAETFAWMGTAGIRKGIDKNSDFLIDSWTRISAEEVTAEVVQALRENSPKRFQALLPTESEIDGLGLGKELTAKVKTNVAEARAKFAKGGGKLIGKDAKWVHFGGTRPTLIPAGLLGSTKDVVAYENVVALVQDGRDATQLAIGSLIRVGDGWRTIDMPEKIVAEKAPTIGGMFLESMMAAMPNVNPAEASNGISKEMQALVASYQKIEGRLSGPDAAKLSTKEATSLNTRLIDVMEELFDRADNPQDKATWAEQTVQTIADGMTAGTFPNGEERIKKFLVSAKKDAGLEKARYGDVEYRWLNILRSQQVANPKANGTEAQEKWKKTLESHVRNYSDSDSAADAMLELGLQSEFEAANEPSEKKRAVLDKKAEDWYQRIIKEHPNVTVAKKAAGAVRRINSEGKLLDFGGMTVNNKKLSVADANGNIVVLHFWATYCKSCLEEMKTIEELHRKYSKRGFRAIGVNVDSNREDLDKFRKKNKLNWPHLFEQGGVDGRPATELGVQIVPTMILIGRDGKVVNRRVNGTDLEEEVKDLLLKEK